MLGCVKRADLSEVRRIMDEASHSPFVGPGEMVTAALMARRYYFDNR
jgi:hypothetical protein